MIFVLVGDADDFASTADLTTLTVVWRIEQDHPIAERERHDPILPAHPETAPNSCAR
jgi:hypothetical protein